MWKHEHITACLEASPVCMFDANVSHKDLVYTFFVSCNTSLTFQSHYYLFSRFGPGEVD